jgi:MoaA/NifB/PqqE/SkfB family radical SAM enzyme
MNIEQIAEKSHILHKFGVRYVFLQGGEPTLRPDLIKIIDLFLKQEIKPTVITNGILLKDKLAEELALRTCNVAVSLDTLDADTFKIIRGVDQLATIKENVEKASKICGKHGNWALTTTVTELSTMEEIKNLESFANDNGFMYAIRPYIHTTGTAGKTDDVLMYKDINRIVKIFEYMQGRATKNNYLASLVYGEHIKYIKGEKQPQCDALRRSMVMSPKGDFSPCIEFTSKPEKLSIMFARRKDWLSQCKKCNAETPCFYNDAREIGIIWRYKWKIALALPQILRQMKKYGNFF